jgi:hypothetical protein
MAVISGGRIIEGALVRPASAASDSTTGSYGPFLNAGAPTSGASGTQFGVAAKGALLIDTTNAKLYINTNTLASPTWTVVGTQT